MFAITGLQNVFIQNAQVCVWSVSLLQFSCLFTRCLHQTESWRRCSHGRQLVISHFV